MSGRDVKGQDGDGTGCEGTGRETGRDMKGQDRGRDGTWRDRTGDWTGREGTGRGTGWDVRVLDCWRRALPSATNSIWSRPLTVTALPANTVQQLISIF